MTRQNSHKPVNEDYMVIGLQILGHVVGDPDLAPRFLALTGLDVDSLRAGAGEPQVLAAAVQFLAGREADLIRAADAIGIKPETVMRAGAALAGDDAGGDPS